VRRAVEMFVAALDRADREANRALLQGLSEEHMYEAALTLMMRLVFLFFAEERDLLPVTNPVYNENYAVVTLHDQLREAANRLGEEAVRRLSAPPGNVPCGSWRRGARSGRAAGLRR